MDLEDATNEKVLTRKQLRKQESTQQANNLT